ncbi:ubiquitin family protein [Dictyocaulus viviparus]|uniref:Ubiquitin family protein n=1 Tax=Dictyocaulus viviparus TaxID=29172 RepID=A0A0D8XKM9_DICVI|nr:ubiquitin family protein [Dictyocaulus viviparus]
MDELHVVVHNRMDHSKKSLCIPFSSNDTVKSIEEKISEKVGVPRNMLRVSFCGRALEETTFLQELHLGPTTSLIAFIGNRAHLVKSNQASSTGFTEPDRSTPDIGSFYVWCKKCEDIKRAKLRVYCDKCLSSAVLVTKEPSCWKDVTRR